MALRCFGLYFMKTNKNVVQSGIKLNSGAVHHVSSFCTDVSVSATPLAIKTQKVSKAMRAYLQRATEHDEFMKKQHLEFQIGKRHLANIMGEDPDTFTQKDVDNAIAYLFPSGIFDPKARPHMKSPDEVFPARKAAEFDANGRPFHSMFYTGKPNFFKLLFDIVEQMNQLNEMEEKMLRRGNKPDPEQKIDLSGYQWLPKSELEMLLVESIADIEYNNFKNVMDRFIAMPLAYKCKEFIDKFKKPLMTQTMQLVIPEPKTDEQGRQYVTTYECLRKTARGDVTVRSPGTGKIWINGKDITYFDGIQQREQVLFPLIFAEKLGLVDVEANVEGGGPSGQAGAIRWGISMSLRSFVDEEMVCRMHMAGLLTRDYRRRERKKYGQEGARRKYTWKKR